MNNNSQFVIWYRLLAGWKIQYENVFISLPRKQRRSKEQINNIRSKAKLMVALWPDEATYYKTLWGK